MRQPNEPIGTVECPHKGCAEQCKVFKFRPRGQGSTRFAGKLYGDCPVHGRFGADGKQSIQEYILDNATMNGPSPFSPPPVPPKAPEKPPQKAPAAKATAPAAPAKKSFWSGWKPLIGSES